MRRPVMPLFLELAQELDSLVGNILRMNHDGSIPDDNPYSNS
jgi:glucose/arabinose dehydrogenase